MARKKKCKNCPEWYEKQPTDHSFKNWCSPECGLALSRAALARQRKCQQAKAKADANKAKRADRRDLRARKEAIKTTSQWIQTLQPIFNKFIRLRDHAETCISCGRTNAQVRETDGWKTGGAWDCGHFLGTGGFPELRFEELNAHKQCKSCNGGSGKYAKKNRVVSQEYEERLRQRIGDDKVDWLQGPHPAKNYIAADLKELVASYRARIRELSRLL